MIDFNNDLWVKNWRIYEDNLRHKRFCHQCLSFIETEKLLQDHPEVVIEILEYFNHILKMRITENPDNTVTMTYRPKNENGSYLLKDAVDFDLIEAIGIVTQQLVKQYNYTDDNYQLRKFY